MQLDAEAVERALACDAGWLRALRREWLSVVEAAVWSGVQSGRLGALPRLRKRILELGERLNALAAPPAWIAHPRERLKSALAAALAVRGLLAQCAQGVTELEAGEPRDALETALATLSAHIDERLDEYATRWAGMLDAQLAPQAEE